MGRIGIPKIIWQTYPSKVLPPKAVACRDSWVSLNPGWEYRFMDDDEMHRFVKGNSCTSVYRTFCNLPLGVMRADYWRYLVIHKHGGLYTDIDTLCREPIDDWLPRDAEFVVCPENAEHLCQWTFLSAPHQPILRSVLALVEERMNSDIDTSFEHFVHMTTGPGAWTDGIMRVLGSQETNMLKLCTSGKYREYTEQQVYIFSAMLFRRSKVVHFFASRYWKEDYISWTTQRDQLLD